jgi:pimeloyl-ACP methyl ester carboxylesterase
MRKAKIARPILNLLTKIRFPISKTKKRKQLDYLKDYPNSGDFNLRRTYADISNTGLRPYLYVVKQIYSFDGENILGNIHIPTLIVHGKTDTIFPVKWGISMSKKIPNSKIILLENVCHEIKGNMTTITKITNTIEEFLKEIK